MENVVGKTVVGIGCLPWIFVFMVIGIAIPLTMLINDFTTSIVIAFVLSILLTIGIANASNGK